MENNQDFEKDQEEFTQQELEQEVLWMRALLELEEKEIPLPESLRSEHLLEKIRDAAAEEPEAEKTPVPDTAPQATVTNKIGNIYCPFTLRLVNGFKLHAGLATNTPITAPTIIKISR